MPKKTRIRRKNFASTINKKQKNLYLSTDTHVALDFLCEDRQGDASAVVTELVLREARQIADKRFGKGA